MNQELISSISQEIYRRFPELSGIRPKVQLQTLSAGRAIAKAPTYLFTYSAQASLGGKQSLARLVRVVVSEQGKIMKVSTSR